MAASAQIVHGADNDSRPVHSHRYDKPQEWQESSRYGALPLSTEPVRTSQEHSGAANGSPALRQYLAGLTDSTTLLHTYTTYAARAPRKNSTSVP